MSEQSRLDEHLERAANWKEWGPYLAERAWGTVREDYGEGDPWRHFSHDDARSRAYRWNEDGLAGISDRRQYLCFAFAFWNGRDPILKERLFGLTGPEGNHGEDVKESYFYLDNTPTHSYMRMLYKYPHAEFPYADLVAENARRSRDAFEYELADTGVFADDRYFDVLVEYAKAAPQDVLVRVTVANRGPAPATLAVLPTIWFRNTWSWGYPAGPMGDVRARPVLGLPDGADRCVAAHHPVLGDYYLHAGQPGEAIFTENETGAPDRAGFGKDAFHRYVIEGERTAVNPARSGTKAAFVHRLELGPGEEQVLRLRLTTADRGEAFAGFDAVMSDRRRDADDFHEGLAPPGLDAEERRIHRQALAGLLWTKQMYYYDVAQWRRGDPAGPYADRPPDGRNGGWEHLNNFDVLSMPDAWEYPWYAAWDLAFHCVPFALVDPGFAKRQLMLLTREWYQHPNGQLPAYEWHFGDANPPVHAWAAWRVYEIDRARTGLPDRPFLEELYGKLLLNFTWWVNRKDADGNNVFQGGFLGLDNVSVIDRSAAVLGGGHVDQSDGTAWMAAFTLDMLRIALELSRDEPIYQGLATKFYEHFLAIAAAMTSVGGAVPLWSEADGFFYDVLHLPDGASHQLRVRSLVGLMPLLATQVLEPGTLEDNPDFTRRMRWFMANRPELSGVMSGLEMPGEGGRRLLAILAGSRLERVLRYVLDEDEFLSPHGIRSLSRFHLAHPYTLPGTELTVGYEPAESLTGLYGGNSNWRGPVWFPINYLIIEALRRYHRYYGDTFTVECPTGSGNRLTLDAVADELARRLIGLFRPGPGGGRPAHGGDRRYADDPHWRDLILFYEYFHGDDGAGLGASHQTGWTALVASLLHERPPG